ncbi:MAG: formylglycine-generating enzyme family protein [Halioglobus sp.]
MTSTTLLAASRYFCVMTFLLAASLPRAQETYLVGDTFSHPLPSGAKGPEMVVLRTGKFVFGGGRKGDGQEALVVDIAHPFAISKTEITAGMYRQYLTATKSGDLRSFDIAPDNLPVYGVSWDQAESFVAWLSHQTGYHYSLPSSTQWEYAARAGSSKTYSWGNAVGVDRANCTECGGPWQGSPAPVGSFQANDWGVYDMQGNVWEWTKDCVDSNSKPPLNGMPQLFGNCDTRELRGGSAQSDAWSIRINARAFAPRKAQSSDVGIRVVMAVPQ